PGRREPRSRRPIQELASRSRYRHETTRPNREENSTRQTATTDPPRIGSRPSHRSTRVHEPGWPPTGSAEWCDPRNLLPALPRVRRRHTQRPRLERLDPIADLRRALELELLRGLAHLLAQRGHPLRQLGRRQ